MDTTDILLDEQAEPVTRAKTGVSFFVFSAALLGLMGMSQLWLLPHFTRVPVNGALVDSETARMEEDRLFAAVEKAEDTRRQLVLPTHDATYAELKVMRQDEPTSLDLKAELATVALKAAGVDGTLALTSFDYDVPQGRVHLVGRIVGVGPRSMTVLASFIDALKEAPFVQSVSTPIFSREEAAPGEFFSPFDIMLTLVPQTHES